MSHRDHQPTTSPAHTLDSPNRESLSVHAVQDVEPTAKELRYASEVLTGVSKRQAAVNAGLPIAHPERIERSEGGREAFRRLMRQAGVDESALAQTIKDALGANKTFRATFEGRITEREVEPDHQERRRAAEVAGRWLDLEPPKAAAEVTAVQVNIQFADGSKDWE